MLIVITDICHRKRDDKKKFNIYTFIMTRKALNKMAVIHSQFNDESQQ